MSGVCKKRGEATRLRTNAHLANNPSTGSNIGVRAEGSRLGPLFESYPVQSRFYRVQRTTIDQRAQALPLLLYSCSELYRCAAPSPVQDVQWRGVGVGVDGQKLVEMECTESRMLCSAHGRTGSVPDRYHSYIQHATRLHMIGSSVPKQPIALYTALLPDRWIITSLHSLYLEIIESFRREARLNARIAVIHPT
jgi:hypothetical protein